MKKLLSLIAISILFIGALNAQSSAFDGLALKKAVKKLVFDTVEYKIYGTTIKTVRLSQQSHDKLSKATLGNVKSLYTQIKNIEKKLNEAKSDLVNYDYPLRCGADMSVESLQQLTSFPEMEIYLKEQKQCEDIYNEELKRLKKEEPKKFYKLIG